MRDMKVRDVMTGTVVVAREDAPFKTLAQLMADHRVSGVPIIDENDRIVGVVTESDLLSTEEFGPSRSLILEWFIGRKRLEEIEGRSARVKAAEIMSRPAITVKPDDDVHRAARVMLDEGVKRLPVVDEDGKVVGIVSRRDLIRPYLRSDDQISREIEEDVILRTMWIEPSVVSVTVTGGVAELRGTVETRSAKEILLELVRRVGGVVNVDDRLSYRLDDRKMGTGPTIGPSSELAESR